MKIKINDKEVIDHINGNYKEFNDFVDELMKELEDEVEGSDKKTINQTNVKFKSIVEVIGKYVEKCHTIAEMKEILGNMSQEEKYQKFKEKGYLNRGEEEWYNGIIHRLELEIKSLPQEKEKIEKLLARAIEDDKPYLIGVYRHQLANLYVRKENLENLAFQYERRLVEGYKKEHNDPPQVDIGSFKEEKQIDFQNNNQIGKLEEAQINSQKGLNLTNTEVNALQGYYGHDARILNSKLNNGMLWNKYSDNEKKEIGKRLNNIDKDVHSAINKSDGLLQDTVLYHGGYFDLSKEIGDKVKFKGYTSATFQKNVAYEFHNYSTVPSEQYYTFRILAPKGTKGWCANDTQYGELTGMHSEQEYLLDKGMECDIVDIDYEKHIVTVIKNG